MIVTLYTEEYVSEVILPATCRGQFWLNKVEDDGEKKEFIEVEGQNENWYLKTNQEISLPNGEQKELKLLENTAVEIRVNLGNKKALIVAEAEDELRKKYRRYSVESNKTLGIGVSEKNDIVYQSPYLLNQQMRLTWKEKEGWYIERNSEGYGIYLNSQKCKPGYAAVGSSITMFSCKILLGKGFLAINNPNSLIRINSEGISPLSEEILSERNNIKKQSISDSQYFYRSPRFKRDVETAIFKIDPPPQNQVGDEIPIMMVIGPSMTMGMASVTTAMFTLSNAIGNGNVTQAVPSLVMSGSMVLGTVMWPIISKNYERNRKRKKEALRQEKYTKYIRDMEAKVEETKQLQKSIMEENYVDIEHCIDRIINVRRNLWERSPGQNDFLVFRIGHGDTLLDAEFKYAERKFTLDDDNLQNQMLEFCESPKYIKNVPLTISLYEHTMTGVIGNERKRKEFMVGLLFQIVSLYSYDEVKLVFIKKETSYEYVKWFPHVWNDEKNMRFIAQNQKDVKDISTFLEHELEYREQLNEEDRKEVLPHYIVIMEDRELANRAEILKKIGKCRKQCGFSLLFDYPELKDLPKDCSEIVEISLDGARVFDKNNISGNMVEFVPDIKVQEDEVQLSKRLSNIVLDRRNDNKKLPKVLTFLKMYGVGKIEYLNVLNRWKENNPVQSLAATVGVDVMGEDFHLDLHERVHGPHGLVAGMTGSGKSEFIMTYILSMAINYHPNEVAFILIDYKGGGMAKTFENLPHTAGIITNLDGSAMKRSLVSIESELKRRQAIFCEVSAKHGVSNVDIYKYQKLYRDGEVDTPLQHLFIISDEFAELKTQQPDFMAKLISAARIGRSLGIHLILATQKPAGVVDDQIWSNSRFRVCLKVQERADSMDMLKRPDAAELVDTGRFYLQVGYNESFQLGQSAWSGAPYYPSERLQEDKDDSVEIIDSLGRVVRKVKYDKNKEKYPNPSKQVDVITEYLQKVAEEEGIKIRPLWLPPLREDMSLTQLKEKYTLNSEKGFLLEPVVGEYDDPERQQQNVFRLPLSREGNAILYGSTGSGKTTFLMTMIYQLIAEHTPEEVQFYIMDFESETLKVFREAPHVGDVIFSHEEEKVENIFKMLKEILDVRKRAFRDNEGDFIEYNNTHEKKFASLVIIIHNYAAFRELYEEREDAIAYLSREGLKYGIYFVLTANSVNGIRFRLLQNFGQQIVLHLNDESDYSVVLGKTDGLYPARYKGRGLVRLDNLYEFQTAAIVTGESVFEYVKEYCRAYGKNWNGVKASRVETLPEQVDCQYIQQEVSELLNWKIPVGVNVQTMEIAVYDAEKEYISLLLGNNEGQYQLLRGIEKNLAYYGKKGIMIFDVENRMGAIEAISWQYAKNAEQCEKLVDDLFQVVLNRNNDYKSVENVDSLISSWEQKVVLISSLSKLKNVLTERGNEKLGLILEKGCADYKIAILIAENPRNLQMDRYENWYKKHITGADGIWCGNGINDQYFLKATEGSELFQGKIAESLGFVFSNGKVEKVKLLGELD